MDVIVKGQPAIEVKIEAKVVDTYKTPDSALSTTSTNPVQNKVITAELDKKATKTEVSSLSETLAAQLNTINEKVEENKTATDAALLGLSTKVDEEVEGLQTQLDSNGVLIEDLQNSKIDKEADDYYPQLSVGLADNLAGTDYTESEIGFRRSGGGAILDGNARVSSVKGNSVVWNQGIKNPSFEEGMKNWGVYGSTSLSLDTDGSLLVTATGETSRSFFQSSYKTRANHALLCLVDFKPNAMGNGTFHFYANPVFVNYKFSSLTRQTASCIIKPTQEGYLVFYPIINGEIGDTANIYSVRVIDLTLMFGAGNEPTTIEEFYARKPKVADENAFNEGEVIHMEADAIKSVGVNQWDEEWEQGGITTSTGETFNDNGRIRSKNYNSALPNTAYVFSMSTYLQRLIFWYDSEYKFLKFSSYSASNTSSLVSPSNAAYFKILLYDTYGTTYNKDICINLSDTEVNGKYFPYVKREESLEMLKKYFPNGMKSAGTAHDEIRWNAQKQKWEAIKRIGEVDMGTLDWGYTPVSETYPYGYFVYSSLPKKISSYNILCSKYSIKPDYTKDNVIYGIGSTTSVIVVDSDYTDVASFKAAMSGVILYYELAEPIVTEIDENFNLDYEVWNAGTEQMIADTPSTPVKASIAYGFNAVGKIKQLEEIIAQLRAKVGI